MKKITTAGALSLAALLLTVSASAYAPGDMAASGQETLKVYSTANAPVLDGVVKTGEYNEAIRVLSYGDAAVYFNGDEEVFSADELKSILPSAMALYATYDDSFLYIACEISDPSHYTPLEGTGVWDGDYLEFDIGLLSDDFSCYNDKLRLAIGMCSEDDSVCAYSALNPKAAAEALALNVDLDGATGLPIDDFRSVIEFRRCRSVRIDGITHICADGEITEASEARVEVVPGAVRFIVE